MVYSFTVENADLSAYTAYLSVWKGTETLLSETVCDSVTFSSPNTIVLYTVKSGDFDVVGIWNAEIKFKGVSGETTTYEERTDTFVWEVKEAAPAVVVVP